MEHIEGDMLLTMPNIPEFDDPNITDEMLEKNEEAIEQLEQVIMSWGVHIQKVLSYTDTYPGLAFTSFYDSLGTGIV